MYPNNNPYGQQPPQQPYGQPFPPPVFGQVPPAPAPMPYGQPPVGAMGGGIWPSTAVSRFVIGTWLMVAAAVVGIAGLAVPALAMVSLLPGLASWVYFIGGLVAAGKEKRQVPPVTDPVMDVALKIAAFTPEQDARFEQIAESMDKGEFPPQQQAGYGQPFPPPQYPQGF